MPELGSAYVQVIPSAEGISGSLSDILRGEAESAGKESGESAGTNLADAMKKVIAAAGIGLAIKKSIDAVGDLAAYGDNIDKMSQKLGISAEAYQEWDAVLQHSGSSIEAMKPVFKTLIGQVEAGSDAFEQLGLSQEQLSSMNQEQIFAATIEALQNMEEGSERTALAQKLLGRGAQELGPLLNTSAEDTEAMKQRVHELGGVMSDAAVKDAAAYQDALQDMQTAISGLSRGLISQFLPGFTQVMNGVSQIFSGDPSGGVGMILEGIGSIGTAIVTAIPGIIETVMQMVQGIIQALVEQGPAWLEQGMQMVSQMASGFIEDLPEMITAAGELINQAISFIMENLPQFLEQGVQFVMNMITGVIDSIPDILSAILEVIGNMLTTIMEQGPEFITKGFELIGDIIAGLIEAIPDVIAAVPQVLGEIKKWIDEQDWIGMGMDLIKAIAGGITKMGSDVWDAITGVGETAMEKFREINWADLGKSIIDGIVSGITKFAENLWNSIRGLARQALGKAQEEIDSHSPSRKFANEVGKWIPLGIAVGIDENTGELLNEIDKMSNLAVGKAQNMLYSASVDYTPAAGPSDHVLARMDAMLNLMAEYYPEMAKGTDGEALFSGMNRAMGLAVM